MNKRTVLIYLFSFFCFSLLNAQHPSAPWGISAKAVFLDHKSPVNDNFKLIDNLEAVTIGGELGLFRNLNNYLNIGLPLKFGRANIFPTDSLDVIQKKYHFSADLIGQLGLFKPSYVFSPYIHAGVGYQLDANNGMETKHHAAFPVGLGFNLKIYQNLYFQAQTQYRFASIKHKEQLHHSVGLVYGFGGDTKDGIIDTDNDGFADNEDDCPMLAGDINGCPDSDGDEVIDKYDNCPEVSGLPQFRGCPDTDEDGVMDSEDECPEVSGLKELKGCPGQDSDGDGVPDFKDKCPNEYGEPENDGCSSDSDNDGVPNDIDKCPYSYGPADNNGCPHISNSDKQILVEAVSNVRFNTGKATLLDSSFPVLDQIVDILNRYPDYQLSISGHTDNIGNDEINQLLSERRAKSCYDYLKLSGINAGRLSYAGYGETQPVASNNTKAGREQNRRVEFYIFLR